MIPMPADDIFDLINETVRLTYIDHLGEPRQIQESLVLLHCRSMGRGKPITIIFGELTGPNTLRINASQVLDLIPVVFEVD